MGIELTTVLQDLPISFFLSFHSKTLHSEDLQANANLAQLVKHCPLKPVIISGLNPTGGNFFALVKSFDTNTAIFANFV